MNTLVVDIDDTLLVSEKVSCDKCGRMKYKNPQPIQEEIDYLIKLYNSGHKIILYTGRNWDCYDITIEQLRVCGIKYHELVMGKPQGVYVDKDAKTSLKEFI